MQFHRSKRIIPSLLSSIRATVVLAFFLGSASPVLAGAAPSETSGGLTVGAVRVAKDFKAEQIYAVPKATQGSWVSMCFDPKGRLIVSDQYGKLYRLTLPEVTGTTPPQIETIDLEIGSAQGLLYAFDSLYVMVAEEKFQGRGLYRILDSNGDDKYDEVRLLRKLGGGGEHGPHSILLSPDRQSLTVVIGNQTKLTDIDTSRVPPHWSEDHLLTRMWDGNGFMRGVLAPGGWIARTDPDGKKWELLASGFRNEFDAAFNREGELFAFDADMEWDLNTPWYRPTRVNHVISGAEFGWRSGAGKWPAYYLDSFGAAVDIGPGSPTGVTFGYGAKFPARYQNALFICDWSFGKLYAVHLAPDGATYKGTAEEFITGQPLALTDVAINPKDGAMYFAVGGRRTQSALYRVTYTGRESVAPAASAPRVSSAARARRQLESFHGHQDANAVASAWRYLGSEDRALRFAARIALEWQPVEQWRERALTEKNPRRSIAALLALARSSSKDEFHRAATDPKPDPALLDRVLTALDRLDWQRLAHEDQLDLLRAYSVAFTRLGKPGTGAMNRLITKFDSLFPSKSRELNAELAPMLVYLEAPSAAAKLVAALASAPTQEEQIDYARSLRVLKTGWTRPLRETYFSWFLKAESFKGGASLANSMKNLKADAVALLSPAERESLASILNATAPKTTAMQTLAARGHVNDWTVSNLSPAMERGLKNGRDFDRGRSLFGAAGCAACHRYENDGASVGPDLTNVAGRFSARDLLESIVEPNKEISDQYGAIVIAKKNGETVTGRVGNLNGDNLQVLENMFAPNDFTVVNRNDVQSITPATTSMMPGGLLNYFKEDEINDLMAYLLSRGNRNQRMFR